MTANPADVVTNSANNHQGHNNGVPTLDAPIARLGLIMAKRLAHHASTRNALKRVVREAFRAQRLYLPAADYVVRLHKRVQDISLTQLKLAARNEADAHFLKVRR